MIVKIICELDYEFNTVLGKRGQPLIKANRQVKLDLVKWVERELLDGLDAPLSKGK